MSEEINIKTDLKEVLKEIHDTGYKRGSKDTYEEARDRMQEKVIYYLTKIANDELEVIL